MLSETVKEAKVKDDVKQAFLAYLIFINSNDKKHTQLKKTVANNHAKGNVEAYPSSCHAALKLMNKFKQYFADKECHNCGKKGHPARCCTNTKFKAKNNSEDDKSVSSSKSIKSLTK